MLTVKYIDNFAHETIQSGFERVYWAANSLICHFDDGTTMTFGPYMVENIREAGVCPVAFVMNERGATVARYDLRPVEQNQMEQAA